MNIFENGKEKFQELAAHGTPEQQELGQQMLDEMHLLQNPPHQGTSEFYASDKCAYCDNYSGYGFDWCGQCEGGR